MEFGGFMLAMSVIVFLRWIGVLKGVSYSCPRCAEDVKHEALICRHCSQPLVPRTKKK